VIINYEILIAYSAPELTGLVKSYISKGWEPCGNMIITKTGGNIARHTFMQPMIKRVLKKEKIVLD
jgi:hypothetical protein